MPAENDASVGSFNALAIFPIMLAYSFVTITA